jgi:hypothetical protein
MAGSGVRPAGEARWIRLIDMRLPAATALSSLLTTVVTAFYWDGVVVPYRAAPVDGTQTLWGGLLFTAIVLAVLLLPAGIARLLNRLDPQPGIS